MELSAAQWQAMLDYAIEYSAGLPVIVGVERPTTETVIEFAEKAKLRNVEAIVVTAPFNKKQSQAEIYQHFVEVIDPLVSGVCLQRSPDFRRAHRFGYYDENLRPERGCRR